MAEEGIFYRTEVNGRKTHVRLIKSDSGELMAVFSPAHARELSAWLLQAADFIEGKRNPLGPLTQNHVVSEGSL